MWEWWDSLESVTRFRWWMGIFAIFSVVVPATFGGLRWLADNRRDYLREQLAKPRQLSPQQEERFLAIVKESPNRVLVQSLIGDQEAYALARQLQKLLRKAGWKVDGDLGKPGFTDSLSGIKIELEGGAGNLEMARLNISVLKHALSVVGMSPTSITFPTSLNTVPYKWIKLYVGSKPKPSD